MSATFENSVFINCPVDRQYRPLLSSLLFTVRFLGFHPRLALESADSGQPRIAKIIGLIQSCRLAIHDLSRLQAESAGDFPRFNMPFELGLDIGCRMYKGGKWRGKKCLILEKEQYRYQVALSDLSSSDICSHGNERSRLVLGVRNWLVAEELRSGPSGSEVWYAYNEFWESLRTLLTSRGFSAEEVDELPVREFIHHLEHWLKDTRPH